MSVEVKLAGTSLDRRIKTGLIKDRVVNMYKRTSLTQKEVAEIFGISRMQVYRYLNYDKALETGKKDAKTFRDNLKAINPKLYQEKRHKAYLSKKYYLSKLLNTKEECQAQR